MELWKYAWYPNGYCMIQEFETKSRPLQETVDVEKQTDNARVGWHSKSKVKVTFLYKALNN